MAGIMADIQDQNIGGGEGGIRTPDTRKGMPDFESGAFNRALPPLRAGRRRRNRHERDTRRQNSLPTIVEHGLG
jgi:hypothetical protein